jgi:hypothetical protein
MLQRLKFGCVRDNLSESVFSCGNGGLMITWATESYPLLNRIMEEGHKANNIHKSYFSGVVHSTLIPPSPQTLRARARVVNFFYYIHHHYLHQ